MQQQAETEDWSCCQAQGRAQGVHAQGPCCPPEIKCRTPHIELAPHLQTRTKLLLAPVWLPTFHPSCRCGSVGAGPTERCAASAVAAIDHMPRGEAVRMLMIECGGREKLCLDVYGYWASKRKRWGKPILRRLQAPTLPNDTNPYNTFRRVCGPSAAVIVDTHTSSDGRAQAVCVVMVAMMAVPCPDCILKMRRDGVRSASFTPNGKPPPTHTCTCTPTHASACALSTTHCQ